MIGICACVVNVVFIALPTEAARSPATELHDQVAAFIVGALFQAKFFLLFSCLIGRGVPIQSGRHAAADRPFARQYGRHLAGLAAIGGYWRPSCSVDLHGQHIVDLFITWPDHLAKERLTAR